MITTKKIVKIYQDRLGREPYSDWLKSFKDPMVRARIRKRVSRVEEGNLGILESVVNWILDQDTESILAN